MNILVTGGCGFIGSNFIRHVLSEGNSPLRRLVNLDALTYAGNPANLADLSGDPRYVFAQGDIGDPVLVPHLLEQHGINTLVHFAAESHVDRSIDSPEPFIETNVLGTLRLLDAARRHWQAMDEPNRRQFRFLHISTDEVFGDNASGPPTTEPSPYAPNSPYAASKAASDHLVRAYQRTYGLPAIILTCTNNYGPYQFPEKLIPLAILNALDGQPIPIYGDGQQVRDWIYVEDHCAAIAQVLHRGRIGERYNVGSANEQTNLDLVRRLCGLLDKISPRTDGKTYSAQISFVADRPGHDRRYSLNASKLCRELDWKPRESFATGLEKTVRWYLSHRAWCDDITAQKYARQRLGVGHPTL